MKRLILLAILAYFSLCSQVYAAESPTITLTAEGGEVGDIVKVAVFVEDNPGVLSFSMTFNYNENALKPLSSATPTAGFLPGATYNATYEEGALSYFFQAPYGLTSQGEMVTFEFEILSTTVCGYSTVRLETLAGNPTFVLEDGSHLNYEELPAVQVMIYEEPQEEDTLTDSEICVTCMDDISVATAGGISVKKNSDLIYIHGYSDGTFAPDAEITRAETAAVIAQILNPAMVEGRTYETDFVDVESDDWYANALGYLSKYSLLTGYEDGTFRGESSITRGEFAVIVSRLAPQVIPVTQQFSDVGEGHWAANAINYGAYMEWFGGYEDGTFLPEAPITRAEAVCILNRILERSADDAVVDTGFSDVPTSHWASQQIRIATQGVATS